MPTLLPLSGASSLTPSPHPVQRLLVSSSTAPPMASISLLTAPKAVSCARTSPHTNGNGPFSGAAASPSYWPQTLGSTLTGIWSV